MKSPCPDFSFVALVDGAWMMTTTTYQKNLHPLTADWSVQDDSGLDALQWAIWEGRHDVESFLLSNGASISDDVYGFRLLFHDQ